MLREIDPRTAIIARSELGCPAERHNEVTGDHAGHRPIIPRGPSWFGEGDTCLFDHNTGDRPPGDLCCGPLKEGREEDVLQRILRHLEGHPNVRGEALHENPLLLERILQDRLCGLQVPIAIPRPRWPPNPTSLSPSPPASGPTPPWYPRSPQGSGLPSRYEVRMPRRKPPPAGCSGET